MSSTTPPHTATPETQPPVMPTNQARQVFFDRVLTSLQSPMELLPTLERAFPVQQSLPLMLDQLSELKKCLDSFRPLNQAQLSNLLEAWDIQYTYESNRIEGNSLTLRETQLVVSKRMTLKGKSIDEHLEARNHQEAIYYIRDLAAKDKALTEYIINAIHHIVLGGIDPHNAGRYRGVDVVISGANHTPPQPYRVKKQMEDIFIWYDQNKDAVHPVVLAATMHEKIVSVHPWIDGNGRTYRLIMNLILLQHGYPIARISGDDEAREQYYEALDAAQAHNSNEPFQKVIGSYVRASLFEFLCMVSGSMDEQDAGKGRYFFEKMVALG